MNYMYSNQNNSTFNSPMATLKRIAWGIKYGHNIIDNR